MLSRTATVIAVLCLLICSYAAEAVGSGVHFIKGTIDGCMFFKDRGWLPITAQKFSCITPISIKTEKGAWGSIVYPFASLSLRPDSEAELRADSVTIKRGSMKVVVFSIPKGYVFRTPQAILGVRGTVFSANASGTVEVSAGKVEVFPENSSGSSMINQGESFGTPEVSSGTELPLTLKMIEAALVLEHDGKYEEAAVAYSELMKESSFAELPEYRAHLLESALINAFKSGKPISAELQKTLAAAVKEFPEAWYESVKSILARENKNEIALLKKLSPVLHKFDPNDPRDKLIEAMIAEIQMNDKNLIDSMRTLTFDENLASASEVLDDFWSDAKTFLQLLTYPNTVDSNRTTSMMDPDSLSELSRSARQKRILVGSSLPDSLLEAQGLYFLLKAYLVDGRYEDAEKVYAFLKTHHSGSPWANRAAKAMELSKKLTNLQGKESVNNVVSATETVDLSFVSRIISELKSGLFSSQSQSEKSSISTETVAEVKASGKISSETKKLPDKRPFSAGSINSGF
ncbi:MAG: FecR domain-containing protein [Candidatus Riflebacteria bacterium]|nr:FecR domain-containing protein [Candidatus Riflebacteria bacterium]